MRTKKAFIVLALLVGLVVFIVVCRKKETVVEPIPETTSLYVGSSTCKICHVSIYNDWADSGHASILKKVTNGAAPTYPFSSMAQPPTGFSWLDMTYVVGGYFWKAEFIDKSGYLITGSKAQYNLKDSSFVEHNPTTAYPPGQIYDCLMCHTTGFVESATEHQDGLAGIAGTWEEENVACEACHGPGAEHVGSPQKTNITINRTAESCGTCHSRDPQHRVATIGAAGEEFVNNRSQYDEFVRTKHSDSGMTCVNCHNPHKSTVYEKGGVTIDESCSSCHGNVTINPKHVSKNLKCVDCHMPYSGKSATSSGSGDYRKGDLRSHVFKIDATKAASEMFYTDGSEIFAEKFLTMNFVCLGCHNGSPIKLLTFSKVQDEAPKIHP